MIDIYFAGTQCAEAEVIVGEKALCRLFSYYNDRGKINERFHLNTPGKLFIDSGAFTAWTRNVEIDVDKYIDFLNENSDHIELAGQVDKIAGKIDRQATPEEQEEASILTWENYLYMRQRLKKPNMVLYTFHIGEDFKFLKQALDWRDENGKPFPYMALGGTVGKPLKQKKEWFQKCWDIIKNSSNPDVKVHAFGMTSMKLLENFPFTSADSTSWIMTGANGGIFSRFGTVHVSESGKNDPTYYEHLPPTEKELFIEETLKMGYSMEELQTNYRARVCYNMLYMYELSKTCNPKYKKSGKKSLF